MIRLSKSMTTPIIGGAFIISEFGAVTAERDEVEVGGFFGATAEAEATGIENNSDEVPRIVNEGIVDVDARAVASAKEGDVVADADARGIEHDSQNDPVALASDVNNGRFEVEASASASAKEDDVRADAEASGIDQFVSSEDADGGIGTAIVVNGPEAYFYVSADAEAMVDEDGDAEANADAEGVEQTVDDTDFATATLTNYGYLGVVADADAVVGEEGSADADATATAIIQETDGDVEALSETINSGIVTAIAEAEASAGVDDEGEEVAGEGEGAYAEAFARAIEQDAEGDTKAKANVTNSGDVLARAFAKANNFSDDAEEDGDAEAYAQAQGIDQWVEFRHSRGCPDHQPGGRRNRSLCDGSGPDDRR